MERIAHLSAVFSFPTSKHRPLSFSPFSLPPISYISEREVANKKSRSSRTDSDDFNIATKTLKLNPEISPHRAVSAVRLMRIEFGGAFSDLLNEQCKGSDDNEMRYIERTLGFRTRDLDNRDRRLVTEIVGGTIRWKRYLDYLILSLFHDEKIFRNMEPLLLQILRIGFYEIVHLQMPPYAVVDENVKLANAALRRGAGNMVNAVLRKLVILKKNQSLPTPKVDGDERQKARALATIHSHPVWMVRRWINLLGVEEAVKLMKWNNSEPFFSLRANTVKGFTRADLSRELEILKVPHELSRNLNDFVRIKTGLQVVKQAGFLEKGLCSVQDESAGLVVEVVDPKPGERIIDCCAAPGGKTLFMASRLKGRGSISAIDINEGRLRILKEAAELHAVDDLITTVHADLRLLAVENGNMMAADKVLLDAPCSGLGVLSKSRFTVEKETGRHGTAKQLAGFTSRFSFDNSLVKPGGVLIYSTCSIDPVENQQRIAAFLMRHQEFKIDPVDGYVPSDFVTGDGFYRSDPIKNSLDGGFAARLVRL
ncbi:hypothetical protein M569_11992 [Genlisea aurea]|uniref:SAM-dependent MTase RsmB/NOP-type domain-containing protein n=1 Tax=Genlisea aurea TaxID=192259 RepID=S8CE55_9LAMI|nr:hypothetical protein M569_11992 [Genlisea aurea]